MFFTLEKFEKRVDELKIRRYFGYQPVAPFISMPGNLHVDEVYHELPEKIEGDMFDIHDFFTGRDKYLWLEKQVKLPEAREDASIVGLFD